MYSYTLKPLSSKDRSNSRGIYELVVPIHIFSSSLEMNVFWYTLPSYHIIIEVYKYYGNIINRLYIQLYMLTKAFVQGRAYRFYNTLIYLYIL